MKEKDILADTKKMDMAQQTAEAEKGVVGQPREEILKSENAALKQVIKELQAKIVQQMDDFEVKVAESPAVDIIQSKQDKEFVLAIHKTLLSMVNDLENIFGEKFKEFKQRMTIVEEKLKL